VVKADFDYDEQTDTFTCPGQQKIGVVSRGKDGSRTCQGDSNVCNDCPYKSRCCQSTQGEARTLKTNDKEPLRQQMNHKMEEAEAKAIYKQRKVIVEPVFGQIKNTGFRGFSVRGKEKTAGEFSLVCAVHNLKKISKAIIRGEIRPKFVKRPINALMV